jgi:hypothetical protein
MCTRDRSSVLATALDTQHLFASISSLAKDSDSSLQNPTE